MAITDSFVLPKGVALWRVSDLPEQLRRGIEADDRDLVLSRRNSRAPTKVIDADAEELVRAFEVPTTIVMAVARFSKKRLLPASQVLEDAFPLLLSLIQEGLLVNPESPLAVELEPVVGPNSDVDSWTILRCVQSLDDTEVYQTRDGAGHYGALKIGRYANDFVKSIIEREARILGALDSTVTPRFLRLGTWESRPYVLMEWIRGTNAQIVCGEVRQRSDGDSFRDLRSVTGSILCAYANLHERGVIHGDVHPRNVLIDAQDAVKIVDFGLASADRAAQTQGSARGGVGFFFEPEYARAVREGSASPALSYAGEQYALAALLYLLITGSHYLDFRLEKDEMLRSIAEVPMLPFAERGIDSWPQAELCLARALSKNPADRFSSVAEFAEHWAASRIPKRAVTAPVAESEAATVREEAVAACAIGGPLMSANPLVAPTASVNYGSAGLAHAFYRIACASDDAQLLTLADVWSCKSIAEIGNDRAFYSDELDITPQKVGSVSLYHGPAGVFLSQALIAQARGDRATQQVAAVNLMETCGRVCDVLDLTLGRAGALLGCALLLDSFVGNPSPSVAPALRNVGALLVKQLCFAMEAQAPIGGARDTLPLGIAHGWAGLLYAILCWCGASGEPFPDACQALLRELAERAEPVGRGFQWKWKMGDGNNSAAYMPGWCNGSAGFVFLWSNAYQILNDPRYLELAEGAAWHAWEAVSPNPSLCCGAAGQAYALLNMHRVSGNQSWLRRARSAARVAAVHAKRLGDAEADTTSEWRPSSLYKGSVGVAVLLADLERPSEARMPLFEREA